ncbi:MAG: glycerol-3-phosphate 1-O-acyltransferase PlsY [Rhodothermaceae bacterium]|nr:glycerol-3-phosphate 1-O-acyltransferase PlsY [Rhodothermaceae bacterium]MXX59765.1 glycerol-3-phosphate 1-O-acyltransferase PlsY [Rhodothermaceae bacterium]MYD19776.1 glycerol-3-phosphate 1-O-acyltransferase PlsY [Rhodothermaceae bacterium]MYD55615.1 glycerol-3-phosphate 1-O-acyltransferase PlsY [Rhodothermaceae bacterium]
MASIAVILLLSYLAGSIPGSVWMGQLLYGVDVRKHGSLNAGATNVFRVLGWKAGVLSTIVDLGKGLLAAGVIASIRIDELPSGFAFWQVESVVRLLAGIAAIVGHMLPVWARFRGGKGVNTAAGVLFAITPKTMWIVIGVFALVLYISRYVSLASIVAAIVFPATIAIRMFVFDIEALDRSLLLFGGIFALAILYAHRSNIRRLIAGTENKVKNFRLAHGMRGRGEL